jgi:phosphoribosyl-AMP cyclohydrolase
MGEITDILNKVKFDERGLVTVVAQRDGSGEVLMVAWMNKEALEKTFASKDVYYWSRSRNKLWRKGETSGHFQKLKSLHIDCDGDTLLIKVDQTGPACHTGADSCFFTGLS